MLYTSKGIVLHHLKYSENSVIAKIYTEKFGLQSFIINGVRNKKSKNKSSFIQPLSLIEINAYKKESKGLQQIKSIKLDIPFQEIPFQIYKTTIAFLIAEVLYKAIKEEENNNDLFNFLFNSIQILDLQKENYINFHLVFLAQLTRHLGFFPQNVSQEKASCYFDFQEGVFVPILPFHKLFIDKELSQILMHLFGTNFDGLSTFSVTNINRKLILNALLNYYSLHLSNFDHLKSKEVLEEILS
jgi:DNA repair protein RecO (recombination protein O)